MVGGLKYDRLGDDQFRTNANLTSAPPLAGSMDFDDGMELADVDLDDAAPDGSAGSGGHLSVPHDDDEVHEKASAAGRGSGRDEKWWLSWFTSDDNLPCCPRVPKGLLFCAIAQSFFAVMFLAVKLMHEAVPPVEIVFWRQLALYLLSLFQLVALFKQSPLGTYNRWIRCKLLMRGFFGFFGFVLMVYAVATLPLTIATLISFLNPIWSSIVAYFILGEKLGWPDCAGGFVALCGVLVITHPDFLFGPFGWFSFGGQGGAGQQQGQGQGQEEEGLDPWGLAAAFLAGWSAACAMVAVRSLKTENAFVLVHYFAGVSVVLSSLIMATQVALQQGKDGLGEGRFNSSSASSNYSNYSNASASVRSGFVWPDAERSWPLLAFITVTGYTAQVMLNRGVQLEKAGRALVMNYLQIVWAFVLSILVLDYEPSAFEFVGAGIIICGTGGIMVVKALGKKEHLDPEGKVYTAQGEDEEGSEEESEAGALAALETASFGQGSPKLVLEGGRGRRGNAGGAL